MLGETRLFFWGIQQSCEARRDDPTVTWRSFFLSLVRSFFLSIAFAEILVCHFSVVSCLVSPRLSFFYRLLRGEILICYFSIYRCLVRLLFVIFLSVAAWWFPFLSLFLSVAPWRDPRLSLFLSVVPWLLLFLSVATCCCTFYFPLLYFQPT